MSISLISIHNRLGIIRFYLVPKILLWFLLSLPIPILLVVFASEWLIHHHMIEPCLSCLHNWSILTVLFTLRSNLRNGFQSLGIKVLRILWSLYSTKFGLHCHFLGKVSPWSAWNRQVWCILCMWDYNHRRPSWTYVTCTELCQAW